MTDTTQAIQAHFEQGARLAQRRKLQPALQEFERCLELAVAGAIALELDQLAAIWLEKAFCYGDLGRWEQTFPLYERIERCLEQRPGWQETLPDGLQVTLLEGYDPRPRLAALHESLGIAYDNAGQMKAALPRYQRAIELYTALENLPKAATVWQHIALGYQRRADWRGLHEAALHMLELWTSAQVIYGQIWAWQYLAQASANQGRTRDALRWMEQAVAAEQLTDYRDLARDQAILADLRRATRGPWARLSGWLRRREPGDTR